MARPQLEFIPTGASQAMVFKIDRDVWPVYHYHPEFDILLSLKDHAGEYVSGDHIGRLAKGTLIMNGPNIPHALHSGKPDEEDWDRPSLAVVQFSAESLGEDLLRKTEMQAVRDFLEEARFGFEFHGATAEEAAERILAMKEETPFERLLSLLRLLELFAGSKEKTPLASPAFSPSLKDRDISRLGEVLSFLQQNKTRQVTLEETAVVAKMSPKSFCRFFKANTGKTLVEYLHELRIGEACRRLLETEDPISEIAFDSGFQNLSHFNRRFRALKGTTPRNFRNQFTIDRSDQAKTIPAARD
ncbi:MAG: AraC family transcriptional regulator [Verrucomicrobiota bacterium]